MNPGGNESTQGKCFWFTYIHLIFSLQTNGFDSLQFSRRIQERRIVAEDLQLQEHELASADQSDLEVGVKQNTGPCLAGMNGIT